VKRRDFIKSFGAGMFSLLGIVQLDGEARMAYGASSPGRALGVDSQASGLMGPFDLDFDLSGNLLVTDPPGYRVVRLDASNLPIPLVEGPGAGTGRLNFPKGIAVGSQGLIYVADSNNCRVQVFDQSGAFRRTIGSVGSIGGSFSTPQGVFVDADGRLLVSDTRNHRVQIFQHDQLTAVLGELGDGNDQFRLPTACAVTPEQDVLVLDSKHGMIKVFGPDLKFKAAFGGVGGAPGQLNMPQGMRLDSNGHIWVADTGNHRIQELTPAGKVIAVVGRKGSGRG